MRSPPYSLAASACLFLFFALALASPHRKIFSSNAPLNVWEQGQRVNGEGKRHAIVFAVKQREDAAAACDSALATISTPSTPSFRQFLTLEQVGKLMSNPESLAAVSKWIEKKRNGRDWSVKTTLTGDFITVDAPIADIEHLLQTEFHSYHLNHPTLLKTITRSTKYSLPAYIAEHVDFVGNVASFPPVKTRIRTHISGQEMLANTVTPSLITSVYGVTPNVVTSNKATQALFEALGQDFNPADLQSFQQTFGIIRKPISNVIGPNDPSQCSVNPNNCGEANLDVEYIMSVAQNATGTYWSISEDAQDPFLTWVIALANMPNPPLVHSISYGSIAQEDEPNDVLRFNTEVCKLGLRGVTVVVSSGDDGVANFIARNNANQCGFHPSFPASSPYVTAVGATQGPESGQPEIACSSSTNGVITTGGGFSYFFTRPTYQATAVANYLKNAPNLPPLNLFNATSRGYPDVATLGFNYIVVIGGQQYQESGTSASAPVFAAMLTLINDALINQNKKPLGFVNPSLYHIAQTTPGAFKDITVGENNCCAGFPPNYVCCQYGFNATTGWDPLTGLGSPKFSQLKSALLAL